MSDRVDFASGPWAVQCIPSEGARLSRLTYDGKDLLTGEPESFRPLPEFGLFETRPAYGYDDCFPSVDECRHPSGADIPDHGEVIWRDWLVRADADRLICHADCEVLPVCFHREMVFVDSTIRWEFTVVNESDSAVPFMHAMHGLMDPGRITGLRLPVCRDIVSEITGASWGPGEDPAAATECVLGLEAPSAEMLLLRDCRDGHVEADFRGGPTLEIEWSVDVLPTLGIWWNVGGYPDADGLSRHECAFEPMAGTWSSLERSLADGDCQLVPAGASTTWSLSWHVRR